MRRWAVPCRDAGQRKLVDEMGAHGVLAFLLQMAFLMWSWKRVRQTETHRKGLYSVVSSHSAIQSKAKSYFNFLEIGPIPLLRWHTVSSTCPPPNHSFSSGSGLCDDTFALLIFSCFFIIFNGTNLLICEISKIASERAESPPLFTSSEPKPNKEAIVISYSFRF